ncbi:MAG TPA: M67 family metallopeptidase, partial [Flavisolibacter sp.]
MIEIGRQALEEMTKDATGSFPDECCGFFFGREEGTRRVVESVLVAGNSKEGDKRRRFEIAPRDYLKAERYADEQELLLLGVYHSHPNHPAIPSEHDRVAAQPYFSYIILSVMDGHSAGLRSWRLNEESQFEEEEVV